MCDNQIDSVKSVNSMRPIVEAFLNRWYLLCLVFSLLLSPALPGFQSEARGDTLALFEQVWDDFDQNYAYFNHKQIDWDQVKRDYAPRFAAELTPYDFAIHLNEMLQILHDWHVWVEKPDGEFLGFDGTYTINYPQTLFLKYTRDGHYEKLGDNVIYHAVVDGNIAHIVIDTLSQEQFAGITENDIQALFDRYAETDGMIIDIRANSGGSEENAKRFASHFTKEERVYGHVQYRIPGEDHNGFESLITKTLEPSADLHYGKPVVCLIGQRCMSSAEWFTLMMRACPNVALIGDKTRGASGNPRLFSLSNGVGYSVSSWIAYTDAMVVIEDNGILPDIAIPAENSVDADHDYLLERAIRFLSEGETLPKASCILLQSDFSLHFSHLSYGSLHFSLAFTYAGGLDFIPDWNSLADADITADLIQLATDLSFYAPCIDVLGESISLRFIPNADFSVWRISLN